MFMHLNKKAMGLMVGSSIFFSLYSNIIATVSADNFSLFYFPSIGLLLGITLYLFTKKEKWKLNWKVVSTLAFLETAQTILYIIGLQIGVISLVAAAHMTVPLWFLGYMVITKQRKFGLSELAAFSLLGISILIIALTGNSDGDAFLGIGFGLASAIFLSLMLHYIHEKGRDENLVPYLPAKTLMILVLAAPAVFLFGDFALTSSKDILVLCGTGLIALCLPIILEWSAIPKLPKVLFSSMILLEIPFTSIWAYTVFSQPFNLSYLMASLVIVLAILLEIRKVANQEPLISHPTG